MRHSRRNGFPADQGSNPQENTATRPARRREHRNRQAEFDLKLPNQIIRPDDMPNHDDMANHHSPSESNDMQIRISADGHASSGFEITDKESKILGENSIERVINMAINIADDSDDQDAGTLGEDLRQLKRLMVQLWITAQAASFAAVNGMHDENVAWTPKMQATVDWIRKEYAEIYGNPRGTVSDVRIWAIYREVILDGGIENYNRLFDTINREGNPS